jgi:PIN domain nuclease of toxin-antitoxin system
VRLLLDTHALIWWLAGDARLPGHARDAIDERREQVFVSAASAWEIATKVRIGKLPGAAAIAVDIPSVILKEGFKPLALTVEHGQRAGALPGSLRDPFDRPGDAREPPPRLDRARLRRLRRRPPVVSRQSPAHATLSGLYLMRWGWSARAPRRRFRSAS